MSWVDIVFIELGYFFKIRNMKLYLVFIVMYNPGGLFNRGGGSVMEGTLV